MDIHNISQMTARNNVTENGTPIIMPGEETDRDLFVKILVAQMTNQDPLNPQDPTEYVSQLAQFSSLEQMMNMNEGMEVLMNLSLNSIQLSESILANSAMGMSSALIGKHVEVSQTDEDNNKNSYSGIVKSAYVEEGEVYIEMTLDETGETKSFKYADLVKINEGKKEI